MRRRITRAGWLWLISQFVLSIALGSSGFAQTAGGLRGTVTDPSGAVVVGATVAVVTPDGRTLPATTSKSGVYELKELAPGKYTVTANAAGFAIFVQDDVNVAAGPPTQFNISLEINVEQQKVEVQEHSTQVDVSPSSNAGALVLTGKDLDALSDDPDELQTDLEALAGPSAGPNGGQLYIDGFTGGQLPPKSSIREIRINQNPFSSEFDKLGYGRIEVFTKPGTDKWHGQVGVLGNSSAFNSKNPFLANEPDYYSTQYMGNVGGPLGKKASVFADFQRRNINEVSIINATVLNPACLPNVPGSCDPNGPNVGVPYTAAYTNPFTRTNIAPRLDYQVSKNNTLTARYQFWRETEINDGVGQLALQSQAYNSQDTEHTLQISDTQVIGSKVVNETRFQWLRKISTQTPQNLDTSISVAGAFSSGGSANGLADVTTNHYELQNYTSISHGQHLTKFGVRMRGVQETNTATANFNGSYVFPSIQAYAAAFTDPAHNQTASQYVQVSGGTQGGGTPLAPEPTSSVSWVDAGLYVQDDWKLRPNLTLSGGLRFETQNQIHDHADWAPRVAVAWGVDGGGKKAAKTVLRAGFGMFYDRFNEQGILQADRFNGVDQVKYIVPNPTTFSYPAQPTTSLPSGKNSPTIYQINPGLRAPYVMQTAVSVERQITKSANLAVSYLNSRGVHEFYSHNINAPIGSTDATDPGVRPLHNLSNVYQYASEGTFKQNQLIVNANVRVGTRVSLWGFYLLNYANANTGGLNTFSSDQYDLRPDWGRAVYDTRHRLYTGSTWALPYAVRLSPFIIAASGTPYNVTVGPDLNGDSIFNDRPSFAANPAGACVLPAAACHYDSTPGTGDPRVPINYLTGPTVFSVNVRVSKTFGFGKETGGGGGGGDMGPGGPGRGGHGGPNGGFGRASGGPMMLGSATSRRYSLTFSVNARNVLNRENLGTPIGNVDSPKFAQSVSLARGPFSGQAASRRVELQASFNF